MTEYTSWAEVPFSAELPASPGPRLAIQVSGADLVMPYNYIPFFAAPKNDPRLGNREALSHESWAENTYSGSITLTWTAKRPIFSGVLSRIGDEGIAVYDVPLTSARHPVLQGTMTKGPLRNLYAAITGSRLDSLPAELPLTYRARPQDALLRSLARVRAHVRPREDAAGSLLLDVCEAPEIDHSLVGDRSAVVTKTVALPREHLNGLGHGERVWAWLELVYHPALVVRGRTVNQAYHYWRTIEPVTPIDSTGPVVPTGARGVPRHEPVSGHPLVLVEAQIHETGERTFKRKHDERLWVSKEVSRAYATGDVVREEFALTSEETLSGASYKNAADAWRAVMESYIGAEPPKGIEPAHYTRKAVAEAWAKLDEGQTLYYLGAPHRPELEVFVPSLISRESYTRSPASMVPDALRPARRPDQLSAVQRVFGTVTEGDDPFEGKGLLEFGGLRCTNITLPAPAQRPWTLAPQGQPKSGYGRFTTVGQRKMTGRTKSELFAHDDWLAGRRVWLHHQQALVAPPPQGWPFDPQWRANHPGGQRPYLAGPDANSATQVIQFTGWIPPGAEFEQTLTFKNLNALELGALLWLLDKPRYHHIGRGRGFGFGSVQVRRTETRVEDAALRRAALRTLKPGSACLSDEGLTKLRDAFQIWMGDHGGAATRTAVMAASLAYSSVRYPSLDEYGDLEKGTTEGTDARPALPRFGGVNP